MDYRSPGSILVLVLSSVLAAWSPGIGGDNDYRDLCRLENPDTEDSEG